MIHATQQETSLRERQRKKNRSKRELKRGGREGRSQSQSHSTDNKFSLWSRRVPGRRQPPTQVALWLYRARICKRLRRSGIDSEDRFRQPI
jgi:hypothetical protein